MTNTTARKPKTPTKVASKSQKLVNKPQKLTQAQLEEQNRLLVEQLYQKFAEIPYLWAGVYLKNHFRLESPGFHGEILQEALKSRFFACAAPRGSAKSTIIAFLIPLHAIIFKKRNFILLISNTYKKAANSLESIKREIKDNNLMKDTFKVEIVKDAEGESIFKHPDGHKIRVLCKGNEQLGTVRGEKFGAYRPDLIIVDDLEDDELVKNPVRRRDLKDLYDEALIPAVDVAADYQILVIGTILHDDSLMSKLVSPRDYKEYNKLFYKALVTAPDKTIESIWPEKYSVKWLTALQKKKPSVFAKEYQNDPSYGIFGVFKRENFRQWTIIDSQYILFDDHGQTKSKGPLSECRAAIACDLAWEDKRSSDFSVILPAYLTPQNDLLVDSYIQRKGMRPHELEEAIFAMEKRLKAITGTSVFVGLEKAKLEKVMEWTLKQAMRRRNHYFPLKHLKWDNDKITRIETRLEARYAMHSIFHRQGMGDLENQLLRLRSVAHDDLADALQGVVQLLEYPRGVKKVEKKEGDTSFEWLRNKAIEKYRPYRDGKSNYIFGNKRKRNEVPYLESLV